MKQRTLQYLAFDIHQAKMVASIRDEGGRGVMRATVLTEAKAILTGATAANSLVIDTYARAATSTAFVTARPSWTPAA